VPDRREPAPATAADLRADCARCVGLCCVAPAFSASSDFAIDKPAGTPCPNLGADFRCGIHRDLRARGFPGCTVYDCFGAGQKVTQVTFGGRGWRTDPRAAARMFDAFTVMRQLHELLWYLTEALRLPEARAVHGSLRAAATRTERMTRGDADALARLDLAAHWQAVNALLIRASALTRQGVGRGRIERRGADLIGASLRGADLRGANLRGAYLIAADLTGADLRRADLIGADLRGSQLGGADLSDSLFLTQPQVSAANGDARTAIPAGLTRPAHWS
jgi:hypothetical protein